MRNLKKVLALVLAMAMSLSLAVTAGAAFNDQDKIVNTEAVDMCSALGIINGYTDGSFKPEGNVTRAEAAKMICIALNGGKEPVLSASATPVFADIAGHWAAKYIEYCNSLGIVAGKSATQFDPNGNVTGVELAKMLLIAIGYDAAAEKFVGANWDTNVNVIASQKDLYEDLESIDPSVAATRDVAAQMVWNALNITMVEYDYKLSTVNGTLTSELVVKDVTPADGKDTLLEKKFDTQDTEDTTGILVKAQYIEKDEEYKYWLGDEDSTPYVTEANYVDLLGQDVTFVVKNDKDDTVYGAFSNSVVVASALVGDYEECKDDEDCIKIDGVEYDVDEAGMDVIGAWAEDHYAYVGDAAFAPYFTAVAIDAEDDGDIDYVIVMAADITTVDYVGKDYIRAAGYEEKLEAEDYSICEGLEKDDMILISADLTLKTLGTITEIEKQTGKVESLTGSEATIGGKVYETTEDVDVDTIKGNMDKDVEFYAYNGYLLDMEETSSVNISDYAIVTKIAAAAGMTAPQAKLLYTDGTEAVVDLVADHNTDASWVGQMVTFDEDDGEYTLTAVESLDADAFDAINDEDTAFEGADSSAKANATIAIGGQDAKIAAEAVVFVEEQEFNDEGELVDVDYVVMTGADVAKITGDASVNFAGAEENSNRALTVTFAYITTEGISTSDYLYGYMVSDVTYTKNADGEFYTATIWNGEKDVELTTVDGEEIAAVEGDVVAYKLDADGAVTEMFAVGSVAALSVIYDDDFVGIDGTKYEIDEDTVILYVDSEKVAGEAGGKIAVAGKDEVDYVPNVIFEADGDNVLTILVVDVTNEWYVEAE